MTEPAGAAVRAVGNYYPGLRRVITERDGAAAAYAGGDRKEGVPRRTASSPSSRRGAGKWSAIMMAAMIEIPEEGRTRIGAIQAAWH